MDFLVDLYQLIHILYCLDGENENAKKSVAESSIPYSIQEQTCVAAY